jgi:ParB family chromosome partitioning protein
MARKNLLQDLMAGAPAPSAAAEPRAARGAIGAVSQSIADLRARAIIEVSADMIDHAGLQDRLDSDEAGIEALAASIASHGQQVPVLLRHSPNYEGRYEVVYGRRRVAALRRLGQPVRALLRDLNDHDLIVAQGQENAARKDLSFIEKAVFAQAMVDRGFARRVVCDALHLDKTVVSRMLAVTERVPMSVIQAIGAAPSAGRDRWLALADRVRGRDAEAIAAARGETSDARFAAVMAALAVPRSRLEAQPLMAQDGALLGVLRRSRSRLTFEIAPESTDFAEWLAQNMTEVHRGWLAGRADEQEAATTKEHDGER